MEKYTITTAPSELPVSLAEVKAYLRVTSTYEDDIIQGLIQAAVNDLEKYTGRWFMEREALGEYDFLEVNKYEVFPYAEIRKSPLVEVNYVKVVQDSVEVAVDGTETKDNPIAYARELFTEELPDYDSGIPRPLKISFNAGYGTADDVPEDIKLAIKKHVTFNYKNRGPCDSSGIDLIKDSISSYRIELGPVGCL